MVRLSYGPSHSNQAGHQKFYPRISIQTAKGTLPGEPKRLQNRLTAVINHRLIANDAGGKKLQDLRIDQVSYGLDVGEYILRRADGGDDKDSNRALQPLEKFES